MEWLREHPEARTIRIAAADLNGIARGKRVPARIAPMPFIKPTYKR